MVILHPIIQSLIKKLYFDLLFWAMVAFPFALPLIIGFANVGNIWWLHYLYQLILLAGFIYLVFFSSLKESLKKLHQRFPVEKISEILAVGIIPTLGLLIDSSQTLCDPCGVDQKVIHPNHTLTINLFYAGACLAFFLVRKKEFKPLLQSFFLALLLLGSVVCLLLTLQFSKLYIGFLYFPFKIAAGSMLLSMVFIIPLLLSFSLLYLSPPIVLLCFLNASVILIKNLSIKHYGFSGLWIALEIQLLKLFGQSYDSSWQAFAKTCGWALSTQEPVTKDCHYLCTVALKGHPFIVKPLRLGTRRGKLIIVNRQLAIANAFEDLLQQDFPFFHRHFRNFYDRVGLPLSHLIQHPIAADFVYLAMKPLEWLFLLYLYIFDTAPETRIERMYQKKNIPES